MIRLKEVGITFDSDLIIIVTNLNARFFQQLVKLSYIHF